MRALIVALLLLPAAGGPARADLDSCLAEAWLLTKITCLSALAQDAGDPRICLRDPDPGAQWLCVARFAEQAGDSAQCQILAEVDPVSHDLCLGHLAVAWREPALCRQLATPNLGDACLLQLVEAGADRALCQTIENPELRQICWD